MKTNIQFTHARPHDQLTELINQKLAKLTRMNETLLNCDVHFILDNASEAENKICEIKVSAPGNDFFAKQKASSFEEAATKAVSALEKQMEKRKSAH
ncbi:MAG: HPF/RaiA family ribosome-associated protein [Bacteroidia bacterium]|nr:HPF/RaiA family ribosome-associated protein [Bacteroidia bacterium]